MGGPLFSSLRAFARRAFIYGRQARLMGRYYRNQDDLRSILAFDDLNRHLDFTRASVEALIRRNPDAADAAAAKRLDFDVDLDRFRHLPAGTVGREWADHLRAHGFTPIVYTPGDFLVDDDASWIIARLRQLHDLTHVVTGFGTDEAGEAGVQGFNLAQMQNTMATIGLAGLFTAWLTEDYDDVRIRRAMDAITDGWRMGRHTRPLVAVDWNHWWERDLEDLRAHIGLIPSHHAVMRAA